MYAVHGEVQISTPDFRLQTCRAGTRPLLPGRDGADLWRSVGGAVYARSSVDGSFAWIDVPGTALFRFGLTSHTTTAYAEPDTPAEHILDVYLRVTLPIGLSYAGHEVLHASAVLLDGRVLGFCGKSGAGKSTLAAVFCRKGYPVFADDALVLDFVQQSATVEAVSMPFSLRLVEGSPLLGIKPVDAAVGTRGRLAGLFVLQRRPGPTSPPQMLRLAPGEALASLLPHTYHPGLRDSARRRSILSRFLDLVGKTPVYRVVFPTSFRRLEALAGPIESVVASNRK